MWKILFLTLLVIAITGATKFQLKGRPRQRLRMSLEEECKKYSKQSEAEKTYNAVMTAVSCLYNDDEIVDSFNKLTRVNSSVTFIDAGRAYCSQRHKIVPCYHVLLQAFSPCAPPAVQEQIANMQSSFEELAEFVCTDDCRTLRNFVEDGGFDCIDEKDEMLSRCSANMTDLTTELPEDTTTFAAIDTCYRYDSMVTCINKVLQSCPKESTLNILNNLFTRFRKGTYCHITLPLKKDENQNKETTDENIENNKL